MKRFRVFPSTWSARRLSWPIRTVNLPALALALLFLALPGDSRAQTLDLASLTCEQVALIAPDTVQATVMGLIVGYAMGTESAAFDLDGANVWFAAFRDLCGQAPKAGVVEVIPLLSDHVAAQNLQ